LDIKCYKDEFGWDITEFTPDYKFGRDSGNLIWVWDKEQKIWILRRCDDDGKL